MRLKKWPASVKMPVRSTSTTSLGCLAVNARKLLGVETVEIAAIAIPQRSAKLFRRHWTWSAENSVYRDDPFQDPYFVAFGNFSVRYPLKV